MIRTLSDSVKGRRSLRPALEALEPRLLLSLTLPGMQVVGPSAGRLDGQVIYLDFDGEHDVTYAGPVSIAGICTPAFKAPAGLDGKEAELIGAVTAELNGRFREEGVLFSTVRPPADGSYSTIYIGGDGAWTSAYASRLLGVAEQVDAANLDRDDIAFVFAARLADAPRSANEYVSLLTDVIAHESGHLLGYSHLPGVAPADEGPLAEVAHKTGPDDGGDAYYDGPVHQYLTHEGYEFYASQYGATELSQYIGDWQDYGGNHHKTNGNDNDVIEGAFDEDVGKSLLSPIGDPGFHTDIAPENPLGEDHPYYRHFVAGGDGGELTDGIFLFQSAYQQALQYWQGWEDGGHILGVVELYNAGFEDMAYYWLGHIAHLLEDLTVPAHVHNDSHSGLPTDPRDQYEDTMGYAGNYLLWGFSQSGTRRGPEGAARYYGSIETLFRATANYTEDYDSQEGGGEGTTDSGWHKPTQVDKSDGFDLTELTILGDDLMPFAIEQVTALFRLFYATVDTAPPSAGAWSVNPYATGTASIRMVATTANDPSGVEYYFDETSGNSGGSDSGWQDSPTYDDTGLNPCTTYSYRVRTRDKSPNQNTGAWSDVRSAITWLGPPDGPDLQPGSDKGASDVDDITNLDNSSPSKTLQFLVGGTVSGATVTLYANGVAIGSAAASGGTTAVTTSGTYDLADGSRSITVRQWLPSQPQSADSAALIIWIDTQPPTASVPDLHPASDTGASQIDNVTQGNLPRFDGTAADPTANGYASGIWKVVVGSDDGRSGTDSGDPLYAAFLPTLAQGTRTVTATAYDTAGNTFTTGGLAVLVDRTSGLRVTDMAPSGLVNQPITSIDVTFSAPLDPASFSPADVGLCSAEPPVRLGGYDTWGYALGVQVVGTLAYVADDYAGLQIIDVSTPAAPVRVGGYDTSGYAYDVQVVGSLAYVADGSAGLQIIDVSNPAAPVRLGGYASGYASGVQVVGTLAYVADGSAGLQIIDVSNPAAPVRLGGYDTSGYAYDVQVVGTLAYVADGWVGLQIIDVSNPAAPVRLGGYDTSGGALAVQVVGTLAYVADFNAVLQIIDVSNPAAPVRLGGYDTLWSAWGVQVVGTLAYVADYYGLEIIRLGPEVAGISQVGPTRFRLTLAQPLRDGSYKVTVGPEIVADLAGNWMDQNADGISDDAFTFELTVDTTPPTMTVNSLTTTQFRPGLSGTVDDPQATITVTVDGNSYPAANNGDGTWTLAAWVIGPLRAGIYDVSAKATDAAGNEGVDGTTDELTVYSTVSERRVFYNDSCLDGSDVAANADDDLAIATDKAVLRPGGAPLAMNCSGYSRGINGIMIDLAGLPPGATPTADWFTFRTGSFGDPGSWTAGPVPTTVAVRRGAGVAGSDRITVIWDDSTICSTWLEATLRASCFGLATDDTFYFANMPADFTGDRRVDYSDLGILAGSYRRSIANIGAGDANLDGVVDYLDLGILAGNYRKSIARGELVEPEAMALSSSGHHPGSDLSGAKADPAYAGTEPGPDVLDLLGLTQERQPKGSGPWGTPKPQARLAAGDTSSVLRIRSMLGLGIAPPHAAVDTRTGVASVGLTPRSRNGASRPRPLSPLDTDIFAGCALEVLPGMRLGE